MTIEDDSTERMQEPSPQAQDWLEPALEADPEAELVRKRPGTLEQQLRELASRLQQCEEQLEHTRAKVRRQRHQLLEQARELEAKTPAHPEEVIRRRATRTALHAPGQPQVSAYADDLEQRRLDVHLRARLAIAELGARHS